MVFTEEELLRDFASEFEDVNINLQIVPRFSGHKIGEEKNKVYLIRPIDFKDKMWATGIGLKDGFLIQVNNKWVFIKSDPRTPWIETKEVDWTRNPDMSRFEEKLKKFNEKWDIRFGQFTLVFGWKERIPRNAYEALKLHAKDGYVIKRTEEKYIILKNRKKEFIIYRDTNGRGLGYNERFISSDGDFDKFMDMIC